MGCLSDEPIEVLSSFQCPGQEKDMGSFTVQQCDIPLGAKKKTRNATGHRRKKDRLTPITEMEEADLELHLALGDLVDGDGILSPGQETYRSDGASSRIGYYGDDPDDPFARSDTPTVVFRPGMNISRELGTLLEDGQTQGQSKFSRLPVPKIQFKRKALSVHLATNQNVPKKPKRKQLLSQRHKMNDEERQKLIEKETRNRLHICEIARIGGPVERPLSAETGARVHRLPSLQDKSVSVPDLPAALNRISRNGFERKDSLTARRLERHKTIKDASDCEHSQIPGSNHGELTLHQTDNDHLRGSDISSFYNMWDWERKRRPFDKRNSDKPLSLCRKGCSCLRNPILTPRRVHNGIALPPL